MHNKVFVYTCDKGHVLTGYKLMTGVMPAILTCKCGRQMHRRPARTDEFTDTELVITSLFYKPCKERINFDPAVATKNDVLRSFPIKRTSIEFIEACIIYAYENQNVVSINATVHPAILLTIEHIKDDK